MFYRVFFDPDVIRPAYESGPKGMSLLIAIWRGFFLNCSICEVDGYLVHTRMGEILKDIGEDAQEREDGISDYITRLKKILVQMEKQNRFVDVLSTTAADQSLPLLALESAESVGIDLILTEYLLPAEPMLPERTSLDTYEISNFERERSKQADGGLIPEGEDTAAEFFPKRFGRYLPFAKRVIVVDGILGKKFGGNFEYTLKRMVKYLETTHTTPSEFSLEIHTEAGERTNLLEQRLNEWCTKIRPKVHRHLNVGHERYLFTDQFGIQLGIGMDLLDRHTERNRGTDFSYARISKLDVLIFSDSSPAKFTETVAVDSFAQS